MWTEHIFCSSFLRDRNLRSLSRKANKSKGLQQVPETDKNRSVSLFHSKQYIKTNIRQGAKQTLRADHLSGRNRQQLRAWRECRQTGYLEVCSSTYWVDCRLFSMLLVPSVCELSLALDFGDICTLVSCGIPIWEQACVVSTQETFFHATADCRNKCTYTNTYILAITISE